MHEPHAIDDAVAAWQAYLDNVDDWCRLTDGVTPKNGGCGLVYELPNPSEVERPDESFAIADMRDLARDPGYSEPHYHPRLAEDPSRVTEIYFVLAGQALCVVGGRVRHVGPGDVVVTPPDTAHYVIPDAATVLVAISAPPFAPENYIPVTEANPLVGFDQSQLERLLAETR